MSVYACCETNRIAHALNHPTINGIRYLEVVDHEGQPASERQRRLMVTFLRPVNPPLTTDNFVVEGGERVLNIVVEQVNAGSSDEVIELLVDRAGDFSLYTLRLIDPATGEPPAGYDPRLAAIEFSFKINCLKDFDCIDDIPGLIPQLPEPDLSYLAKDFTSFRQLMLDRLAVTAPQWRERNLADFGMVMVEMLAYVGDQLSEFQDIVATEPYLATARSRISVRRHARLVDYLMHDGCNARTWVFLQAGSQVDVPGGTQLLTYVAGVPASIAAGTSEGLNSYQAALQRNPEIFETMAEASLFPEHNTMPFYTWGDEECCLPAGATAATLRGHFPNLAIGDLVLLEEIRGAETGALADADPHKRHVVRLKRVRLTEDPIGGVFTEGFGETDAVPVTEIAWDARDGLPFALCLSTPASAEIAVARGNIVLADHGVTISEDLGDAPEAVLIKPTLGQRCEPGDLEMAPARFRPRLLEYPLTQATPYLAALLEISGAEVPQLIADLDSGTIPSRISTSLPRTNSPLPPSILTQRSGEAWLVTVGGQQVYIILEEDTLVVYPELPYASGLLQQDPRQASPQIYLDEVTTRISDGGIESTVRWTPLRDLLNTTATDFRFVVEIENDGRASLRFGDDLYGKRPQPNDNPDDHVKTFIATYRVGNGRAGNIGAETLAHIVTPGATELPVTFIRNPVPAQGGTEFESIEQVRQSAPVAFRTQERAVTQEDYAKITARHPLVQRAVATFRWASSWYTVFITVDPVAGVPFDAKLEDELRAFIEPYRMAGHDVEFNAPVYVPLEIEMYVCVAANQPRRRVRDELLRLFSSGLLPDGTRGVFHPDNFTFGQTVYLSPLYAAAMRVEGISQVEIRVFKRQNATGTEALDAGKIVLQGREIARLDNDPNHPTNGVFRLIMEGGR
jgi:hypothetical protein